MRRCLGVLTSVACVVVGICLIAACVDIYMSGNKPFSPEAVAQRFDVIDVTVYVCLSIVAVCALVSFVLSLLFSAEKIKTKAERYSDAYINSLYAKADLASCDLGLAYVVKTQRKKRFVLSAVLCALLVVGTVVFCVFSFNPDNYQRDDVNASVIKLSFAGLICFLPAAALAIVREFILKVIRKTEGDALKRIISDGNTKTLAANPFRQKLPLYVKFFCIILAAAFITYGFLTGGSDAVLVKAVNLCMECVGLG